MTDTENMNTNHRPDQKPPAETSAAHSIRERKAGHITYCIDPAQYRVEPEGRSLFSQIRLLHNPLPEVSAEDIDTRVTFLEHQLKLPLFISCMTGGSAEGHQANRNLARAAQLCGIPVGTGSIRILFKHPELLPHFHLKAQAPDVPVLANIGIIQLKEIPHKRIIEMVKQLEVQALVIHLNPGQELFQPGGDTDFRDLKESLRHFRDQAPFPLIIKETGFGIPPAQIAFFSDLGISYIDLAGSGGTNWIAVESYRLPPDLYPAAREFDDWGYPTCLLLDLVGHAYPNILASGGLRSGSDLAKALAMGACAGGMALPFIRAVTRAGVDGVCRLVQQIEKSLRVAMTLTASGDIAALRQKPIWRDPEYGSRLEAFKQAIGDK